MWTHCPFVCRSNEIARYSGNSQRSQQPDKIISKIENHGVALTISMKSSSIATGWYGCPRRPYIEVLQERIPGIQRKLIRKCVKAYKPVIVATQMLHSMIENPRPTRAEGMMANAIYYSQTDALYAERETFTENILSNLSGDGNACSGSRKHQNAPKMIYRLNLVKAMVNCSIWHMLQPKQEKILISKPSLPIIFSGWPPDTCHTAVPIRFWLSPNGCASRSWHYPRQSVFLLQGRAEDGKKWFHHELLYEYNRPHHFPRRYYLLPERTYKRIVRYYISGNKYGEYTAIWNW